jgi:hypothetical protein
VLAGSLPWVKNAEYKGVIFEGVTPLSRNEVTFNADLLTAVVPTGHENPNTLASLVIGDVTCNKLEVHGELVPKGAIKIAAGETNSTS